MSTSVSLHLGLFFCVWGGVMGVRTCEYLGLWGGGHVIYKCVCICEWRPEINIGCLPKALSTVVFETKLSLNLQLTNLVASPRDPSVSTSPTVRLQVHTTATSFLQCCGIQALVLILTQQAIYQQVPLSSPSTRSITESGAHQFG